MTYLFTFCAGVLVGVWLVYTDCPHEWKEWVHDLGEKRRHCTRCKTMQWMSTVSSHPQWHTGIPRKYGALK